MIQRVAAATTLTFPGFTSGAVLSTGLYPACRTACDDDPRCQGVTWLSEPSAPSHGACTLLGSFASSNADARYTTYTRFQHSKSPASGFFFDDPDWGVCGAIRQYSNDTVLTDAVLEAPLHPPYHGQTPAPRVEDLYDGTVAAMIQTAQALNAGGQVPIFAVTNGFFNDPTQA